MRRNEAAALGYTQHELDAMSKEDLLLLYKSSGDEALKWPLALRYVGLVKSIALQVRGVYSSFAQVDDIVNEGLLTLAGAVDKFDPDKGIKFETYVSKRIRGAVIDLARRQDWVPRSVRRKARDIDQASSELFAELGRYPTDQEMAEQRQQLNDSIENYIKIYNAGKGYDAILYRHSGVYFNPDLDITNEIIEGLNARYNKVEKAN